MKIFLTLLFIQPNGDYMFLPGFYPLEFDSIEECQIKKELATEYLLDKDVVQLNNNGGFVYNDILIDCVKANSQEEALEKLFKNKGEIL